MKLRQQLQEFNQIKLRDEEEKIFARAAYKQKEELNTSFSSQVDMLREDV